MKHLRLLGVQEQLERAQLLCEAALRATDGERLRFALAAVYPARSAVELMRESAKSRHLVIDCPELDRRISDRVPYVDLVWALRVYDFHRLGLRNQKGAFLLAKVKVPALSTSTIAFGPLSSPTFDVTNSDGSLPRAEFLFWAPPFAQVLPGEPPVHILAALLQYLEALALFLPEFESLTR